MQYLLMIYQNEAEYGKIDAATGKKMLEEYGAFTQSIIQSGNFQGRRPPASRPRRDHRALCAMARRSRTDGRSRKTREQLGGYYLVEGQGSGCSAGHCRADFRAR